LIRAWYVTKHTHKALEAVLSVVVDRAIGLSGTLVIAGFVYFVLLPGREEFVVSGRAGNFIQFLSQHLWIVLGAAAVATVVFGLLLLQKAARAMLRRAWLHIQGYGGRIIKKTKDAIIIYCRRPLSILAAFGLTIFLQVLTVIGFWFLGTDMGVTVSIKYYFICFPLTWVLGALPISIGGAVVVEFLLAALFVKLAGIGVEVATALALSQRAVWMLTSLPGAVIHLMGAHLPKDFFIDYAKTMN